MKGAALTAGLALALTALCSAPRAEQIAAEPRPAGMQVVETDMGPVYADARGKTLYTWAGDSHPGKSLCNDVKRDRIVGLGEIKMHLPDSDVRPTCTQLWPAAVADGPPVGKWDFIVRDDGVKQWTYGGKPLYTTVLDKAPGDIAGRDLSVFSTRTPLAAPTVLPPGVTVAVTLAGRTLTNADGWTLYTYDKDPAGKSACVDACARTRVPMPAPELAPAMGDWTPIARADGSRQWAFKGKPLYTYADDERRRDLGGQEAPHWKAAVLQPAPKLPEVVKVNATSAGDVYADSRGMTLYYFRCGEESQDAFSCDTAGSSPIYRLTICGGPESCMATWKPLVAAPNARAPNKLWSVVEVDPSTGGYALDGKGGLRVWAFNGRPLYTYAGDKRPGDYKGHDMRVFPTRGFTMMLTSYER